MTRIKFFGSWFAIIMFIKFFTFSIAQGTSIEKQVLETQLNQNGSAYEVNVGVDGVILVSDNYAGEIRIYQPDGKFVRIISGLGSVSDARADASGKIWFVEQETNKIVRLDLVSLKSTSWGLGSDGSVFGTNIDNLGNIWVTKFNRSTVFRLTPGENNNGSLCEVDLSTAGYIGSDYIVDQSGNLWLGGVSNQIVYVQPGESDVDVMSFSPVDPKAWSFTVEGLIDDESGGLWFADTSLGRSLVHFVPTPSPQFCRYALPTEGGTPFMITLLNSEIWYSGFDSFLIGKINPTQVSPINYLGSSNLYNNLPMICNPVSGVETIISSESFTPQWTQKTYPITELSGWKITNLDNSSNPWGITSNDGSVWTVDNYNQVLIRFGEAFDNNSYIFLPLVIK